MTANNQIDKFLKEITDTGDFDIVGYEEDILKSIMATPDEILDDMKTYGVFDEQIIQPIQQPIPNQPQQVQQPTPNQPQMNIQIDNKMQEPQMSQADTMRTIICPNCGEVIRLD